jgi:enamine deaminase RidA (YjgF/YER057c/UK114 family)
VRFDNPPSMPAPVGYSHLAEVSGGRTIYIAGQVALDRAGNLVGKDDLRAQTRQVFLNLSAALEAVGADFRSVVRLTYYLRDISQIPTVREVRDQFVNVDHPPTSSAIEVRSLFRKEFLLEIDAVAVASAEGLEHRGETNRT